MNRKSYLNFIINEYSDYLLELGYTKIYQDGQSIRIDKNKSIVNNNLGIRLLSYDTIRLDNMRWSVQFKEIDTPIIRAILSKDNKSEKYIKEIISDNSTFQNELILTRDQARIDIYNYEDAKESFELIRTYIKNEIEPFFTKYSNLRYIYDFLITATEEEIWEKSGGIAGTYRKLFIYKIYNEDKYQEWLKELMPYFEENEQTSKIAAFDELVAYIENNVTRLRELYAPEML